MASVFSTADVRPSERLAYWHDVTCRAYSITEAASLPRTQFRARCRVVNAGTLEFGELSLNSSEPIKLVRRSTGIRRDFRDNYVCLQMLSGETQIAQEGHTATLRSGELMLYDQARPFDVSMAGDWRALAVNIPRALVKTRLLDAGHAAFRIIDTNSPFGSMASAVLRKGATLDEGIEPTFLTRFSTSALDILSIAIEAVARDGEGLGDHKRLRAVKRFMAENLHDAELDVAAVSRATQVPPRTLNRWFVATGTTPMRWLWDQRLAASYRALSERRETRVTDVAMAHGFNDLSHFSRAFKQVYGCTPGSLVR